MNWLIDFLGYTAGAVLAILPIVNPLGAVPLVMAVASHLPDAERQRQIRRACIYTFALMTGFLVAGSLIMSFFGISIPGMRIAGGTIRATGSRDELRAEHAQRRFELISAGDAGWLRNEPGVEVVSFDGGYALFDADTDETAQRVLRRAIAEGAVTSFAPRHPSLAQIFKEVIQ